MSKSRDRHSSSRSLDPKLTQLEALVDELIKDSPREEVVRVGMEAIGLVYTPDPIACMTTVLTALDDIRASRRAGRKMEKEL